MQNMQGHVPESTCIPYKTPEHTSQTQVTMYNVYCIHFILQGELLLHRFFYGAYHLDNKLTIIKLSQTCLLSNKIP